jgi:hypothetical protein
MSLSCLEFSGLLRALFFADESRAGQNMRFAQSRLGVFCLRGAHQKMRDELRGRDEKATEEVESRVKENEK